MNIVHTDRGSQFAGSFQSLLRKHQLEASVSQKENPYDNALNLINFDLLPCNITIAKVSLDNCG
jgi:transposase InsO family protein